MWKFVILTLAVALLLAGCKNYRSDMYDCENQFVECMGDCGDQIHLEIPVEGDCIQQCLQSLSKCMRRIRN